MNLSTQLPGAPLSPPLNLAEQDPAFKHPIPKPSLSHSRTFSFARLPIRNCNKYKAPAVPNAYAPNASPKVHSTHKKR